MGVAFSRFLGVSSDTGIYVGMAIVFFYAVFGGMKGITYTQVAQYIVLILAYTVPAMFISAAAHRQPDPQLGLGSNCGPRCVLLATLDKVVTDLGFGKVHHATAGQFAEHVHVHHVADDRYRRSAACHHAILYRAFGEGCTRRRLALIFIAILYTTAPAVAAMAKTNLIRTITPGVVMQDADPFGAKPASSTKSVLTG